MFGIKDVFKKCDYSEMLKNYSSQENHYAFRNNALNFLQDAVNGHHYLAYSQY